MRRIDRYLISEMIVPAVVGGLLVVMLLVGNQLYGLLKFLYNGVPVHDVLMTLAYFTPGVLMLAIPAALLLGSALGLNRLERDREILSMRMAGVRLKRIVLPIIVVGIFAAGLMFYLQERVIPYTTHEAIKLTNKLTYGSTAAVIPPDQVFKIDSNGVKYFVYVHEADPTPDKQTLRGIVVARIDGRGYPKWVRIPVAENRNGQWLFLPDPVTGEMPQLFLIPEHGKTVIEADGENGAWDIPRDAFDAAFYTSRSADEFTFHELLAVQRSGIRGASAFTVKGVVLDSHNLLFYLHRKLAAPLAALVAILIAIPLSIHFGRSGGYVGLLLSVVVAFCFIVTQQWTQVLAETNRMQPILAAWAPDAFFGILGIILLFREE